MAKKAKGNRVQVILWSALSRKKAVFLECQGTLPQRTRRTQQSVLSVGNITLTSTR